MDIFTDGACSRNPGPGGWAYLVRRPALCLEADVWEAGYCEATTNNQMELTAVIKALMFLRSEPCDDVRVYCDSRYVIDGITKWIHTWRANEWRTSQKKPVENRGLWEDLYRLTLEVKKNLSWIWVKGHGECSGNNFVDEMAQKAMRQRQPLSSAAHLQDDTNTFCTDHTNHPSSALALSPVKQAPFPIPDLNTFVQWYGQPRRDPSWCFQDGWDGQQPWDTPHSFEVPKQELNTLLCAWVPGPGILQIDPVFLQESQSSEATFSRLDTWAKAQKDVELLALWGTPARASFFLRQGFHEHGHHKGLCLMIKPLIKRALLGVFILLGSSYAMALGQEGASLSHPVHGYFKEEEINWRTGPGKGYKKKFFYKKAKYWPVVIQKNFEYWYKVTDILGRCGWVHQRLLHFKRVVFITAETAILSSRPGGGRVVAYLKKGVLGLYKKEDGSWYFVELARHKMRGWVRCQDCWDPLRVKVIHQPPSPAALRVLPQTDKKNKTQPRQETVSCP